MKISIITVFPEIYDSFLSLSLIQRAQEKGFVEFNIVRFSDMCDVKERIDGSTCGPGAGMVIKPEVFERAINSCEEKWGKGFKIFFSPQGKKLNQKFLKKLANKFFNFSDIKNDSNKKTSKNNKEEISHLILICPRYEGIDTRVEEYYADLVVSIGDYVLMGGDLPSQVFIEGLLRLLPGVVGKQESVEKESFSGSFLDHPEYGLPVEWKNEKVPEVILSGNHAQIEKWRNEQAAKKTIENRIDWFLSSNPSKDDINLCKQVIPNHYVALMHTQVNIKNRGPGQTSVTSLDIHDIARSCATYGIENYFIVTPLKDQQKIVNTFLEFWYSQKGREYNSNRFEAVKRVKILNDLDDVIEKIKEKENGVSPLIITTSAQSSDFSKKIDFFSQGKVFKQNMPVLFLFGTAQGLCDEVVNKSDYLLVPVEGLTDFNHLSVRSAVAVVLDRWLGLKPRIN